MLDQPKREDLRGEKKEGSKEEEGGLKLNVSQLPSSRALSLVQDRVSLVVICRSDGLVKTLHVSV